MTRSIPIMILETCQSDASLSSKKKNIVVCVIICDLNAILLLLSWLCDCTDTAIGKQKNVKTH